MGIQINGSTDTISAVDGSLSLEGGELRTVSGLNVTGVVTATSYQGDGSALTGIAATDNVRTGILDVAGVGTFRSDVNVPDSIIHLGDTDTKIRFPAADTVTFETGGSERARIDSSGNFGVGTASPQTVLQASGVISSTGGTGNLSVEGAYMYYASNEANFLSSGSGANRSIVFSQYNGTTSSERARIDSSGRLLVGTTSARTAWDITPRIQHEGTNHNESSIQLTCNSSASPGTTAALNFSRSRGSAVGSSTVVDSQDYLGVINFAGADGTDINSVGAQVRGRVDGTPGSNDMPGRLEFTTTSDGSASPTERMRISSDGSVFIAKTGYGLGTVGVELQSDGKSYFTSESARVVIVNKTTGDGILVGFYKNTVEEGNISVSGSTVQLNGAHLSRWSQLPGNAERTEILRGSVLSNLDEMCEWAYDAEPEVLWAEGDELPEGVSVGDVKTPAKAAGTENNEQLNRMKVSDVEGDKNVAGVFVSWDDDDDTHINDFYCAMTGDFIIRIAQGVTVERGDLLMSAGDGTAKPQDDDIIRSKTIAKVTSTNVSCTYDDGSYCVPCVLMAC